MSDTETHKKSKKIKKSKSRAHYSEEEEDSDHHKSKKSKKSGALKFIQTEADVGGDEDEDDDDFIEDGIDKYEVSRLEREMNERIDKRNKRAEDDRFKRPTFKDLIDEDEYGDDLPDDEEGSYDGPSMMPHHLSDIAEAQARAKEIEDRYQRSQVEQEGMFGESAPKAGIMQQQALLPTIRDPKLFCCRCIPGKEREALMDIMKKFIMGEKKGPKLFIKSAFVNEVLKGYVYIEAEKEAHVKAALEDVRFINKYGHKLVPINEMVSTLQSHVAQVVVKKGQWVRMKRGLYKNDLAQIQEVEENGTRVNVKLIPRIDFGTEKRSSKSERPPSRLLNVVELRDKGAIIDRKKVGNKYYDTYDNNLYRDGYLYKEMPIGSIETDQAPPTPLEIENFERSLKLDDNDSNGQDALMSIAAAAIASSSQITFAKNSLVQVVSGDLINMTGVVKAMTGNVVHVIPLGHEDLKDAIEFSVHELRKYFKQGDHVKVEQGPYKGETGFVVNVESNSVRIFTDSSQKEISVFSHQINESTEVSSGKDSLGQFRLHDLVTIIQEDIVAVIIKIGLDSLQVLDFLGSIRNVQLQDIALRKPGKFSASFDVANVKLEVGDMAQIVAPGPLNSTALTIEHIWNHYIFGRIKGRLENNGVVVFNSKQLKSLSSTFAEKSASKPVVRVSRNDPLLNKSVRITSGQWKGQVGIVRDISDRSCRVELHSFNKIIPLTRDQLAPFDPTTVDSRSTASVMMGSQTPNYLGMQTPMYGSGARTPLYGTKTPMHNLGAESGSQTPVPDAFAPITPLISSPMHTEDQEDDVAIVKKSAQQAQEHRKRVLESLNKQAAAQQPVEVVPPPVVEPPKPVVPVKSNPANNPYLAGIIVSHSGKLGYVFSIIDASLCSFVGDDESKPKDVPFSELSIPEGQIVKGDRIIVLKDSGRGRIGIVKSSQKGGDLLIQFNDDNNIDFVESALVAKLHKDYTPQ